MDQQWFQGSTRGLKGSGGVSRGSGGGSRGSGGQPGEGGVLVKIDCTVHSNPPSQVSQCRAQIQALAIKNFEKENKKKKILTSFFLYFVFKSHDSISIHGNMTQLLLNRNLLAFIT